MHWILVAVLVGVTVSGCNEIGSGESDGATPSPTPIGLAQACERVGVIAEGFKSVSESPEPERLRAAAADLTALSGKATPDAQALITPLAKELRQLSGLPARGMATSPTYQRFIAAAKKLFDSCVAVGAPLPAASTSTSAPPSGS